MEQTSSAAYPNILAVEYVKKARVANATAVLMKAEQFLNVGYLKLLTFERPGGGFDWWGNGEPLVWLSAYGLHEFNDMARVYPIDRGVIDRTQAWLLKQRAEDGTWSKIGATHEALTKALKKLEEKKEAVPDWKAIRFPAGGQSLSYAHGDSLTVETTAL